MHEFLLSLGIPLLFIVLLTMLRCIAAGKAANCATVQDAALDVAFLGTGAVGITIYNDEIQQALKTYASSCITWLFVLDFTVIVLLVYLGKFYPAKTRKAAFWNMVIGAFPIMAVAALTWLPRAEELLEKVK
jgi:hypothetical protein